MILITDGVLDVESVKKEFSEERHCFQYFKYQEDRSLYPIDHNDVAGEVIKFCLELDGHEDTFYSLEYESIIYDGDKSIHVFQNSQVDMEILITEQNGEYALMDIRSLDNSIYKEDETILTCQ